MRVCPVLKVVLSEGLEQTISDWKELPLYVSQGDMLLKLRHIEIDSA